MGPEADRILEDGVASLSPPTGAKSRGWRALQERLEPPATARPRWIVPLSIALALAAALVLVWSLAGTRTTVADRRDAHDQALDDAPAPTPMPTATPTPAAPAAAPAIVPAPAPAPAAVPIQRPRAASTDPLADETALLAEGQRALAGGHAELALDRARAHRRRFPQGDLAEDAGALEIAALCGLGRPDEAATAAAALHRRFAGSPIASALADRPCRE